MTRKLTCYGKYSKTNFLTVCLLLLLVLLLNTYINDLFISIPRPIVPSLHSVNKELNHLENDTLEQTLFQKYAIISVNVDADPGYFYHLPIVALTWRRVFFEPLFILVHSDRSKSTQAANLTISYLNQLNVKVFHFKAEANYELMSAMVVREMSGLLPDLLVKENDFILTSDSDLYPLNPKHYGFANDNSIKLWNADCSGAFKLAGQEYVMYQMGHIGMRKYQWREVMGLDADSDKLDGPTALKVIKKFNGHLPRNDEISLGDDYWYMDQRMVSVYIDNYVKKLKRAELDYVSDCDPGKRIDRQQTKRRWARIFTGSGVSGYNDMHTFHDIKGLFGRYNFYQLLFAELFSRRVALLLNKYTLEYTRLINVRLDETFTYL